MSKTSKERNAMSAMLLLMQLALPASLLAVDDPDFSHTPLPKLVLPPEPPGRLRLPEVIVKDGEWRGVQCGVQEARFAIFKSSAAWASFWEKALRPYSKRLEQVPGIDFERHMVVGVFLGEKTTPNFEIEIRSANEEDLPDGKALVVRYREIKKMQGVFIPPYSIQPFHLRRIPAFTGQVTFQKAKR